MGLDEIGQRFLVQQRLGLLIEKSLVGRTAAFGDEKELGKPVGSDAENEKITYAALVGIEKAKSDVKKLTNAAVNQLDIFENSDFLKALALSLVNRKK